MHVQAQIWILFWFHDYINSLIHIHSYIFTCNQENQKVITEELLLALHLESKQMHHHRRSYKHHQAQHHSSNYVPNSAAPKIVLRNVNPSNISSWLPKSHAITIFDSASLMSSNSSWCSIFQICEDSLIYSLYMANQCSIF